MARPHLPHRAGLARRSTGRALGRWPLVGLALLPWAAAIGASPRSAAGTNGGALSSEGLLQEPSGAAAARPLLEPKTKEPDEETLFFGQCDQDKNDWISYTEAKSALEISREEFFSFDNDRDGRITRAEFGQRYREIVARTGGFLSPKVKGEVPSTAVPPRSPEQLRNAFDTDFDGRLAALELEAFLKVYPIPDLTPGLILTQLDGDASGNLSLAEIEVLATLLDKYRQALGPAGLNPKRAQSLRELFGEPTERGTNALPEPPLLLGPLPVFERLDLDADGGLDEGDLFDLQYPLTLPVRGSAVLAALDVDGDGALSKAEFEGALGRR